MSVKLGYTEDIKYVYTTSKPSTAYHCEYEACLILNDFIQSIANNSEVIFYPTLEEDKGEPDFFIGMEKDGIAKTIRVEAKSALYCYYNSSKDKTCYDGEFRFELEQLITNENRLFLLMLKSDKQVDRAILCYFNSEKASETIFDGKDNTFRYRFNKQKVSAIRQGYFLNTSNGHRVNLEILSEYSAADIKELTDFWNACSVEERKEYLKILSISDILKRQSISINELNFQEVKELASS